MPTILALLAIVSFALTVVYYSTIVRLLRRPVGTHGPTPGVTVLKPLKGVDDQLFENLLTFVRQDYPVYQIVFGVQDPDDPALEVARRIQRENPDVDIDIVETAPPLGRNPKVRNLASMARRARYDYYLISDSNCRVRPSYLRQLVAEFRDPTVGLVTAVLAGIGERSLGALLENLHLGSFIAAGVCSADVLTRHKVVVGKTMLFPRRILEELGGWASVRDILAEDYVLGRRFEEAGYRVVTSPHVVETVNESWPVRRFLNRHVRWLQIRRRLQPLYFFGEPFLNPVFWLIALMIWSALAGSGAYGLEASTVLAVCAAGILMKTALDAALVRHLRGRAVSKRDLLWIPIKDLVIAGAWLVAAFRRRVWWRGNHLWIGPGTMLLERPTLWQRLTMSAKDAA